MKTEFQFNDCGVCTNPIITFYRKLGKWTASAKIAQSPNGKWDFGYNVSDNEGGVCCPIMLQKGDEGLSEEDARVQSLEGNRKFCPA